MKKVRTLKQLDRARGNLFIKVTCPNCKNMLISLVPDAENILRYRECIMCYTIMTSITTTTDIDMEAIA